MKKVRKIIYIILLIVLVFFLLITIGASVFIHKTMEKATNEDLPFFPLLKWL